MKKPLLALVFALLALNAFAKANSDPTQTIYISYEYDDSKDEYTKSVCMNIINDLLKPYYESLGYQKAKSANHDLTIKVSASNVSFVATSSHKTSDGDVIVDAQHISFDYTIHYMLPNRMELARVSDSFFISYPAFMWFNKLPKFKLHEFPALTSLSLRSMVPSKSVPVMEIGDSQRLGIYPELPVEKKPVYKYCLSVDGSELAGKYADNANRDIPLYFKKSYENRNFKETDLAPEADLWVRIKTLTLSGTKETRKEEYYSDGKTRHRNVDYINLTLGYELRVLLPGGWFNSEPYLVYHAIQTATGSNILPVTIDQILDSFPDLDKVDLLRFAETGRQNRLFASQTCGGENLFPWLGARVVNIPPNTWLGKDVGALEKKTRDLEQAIEGYRKKKKETEGDRYRFGDEDHPEYWQRKISNAALELEQVNQALNQRESFFRPSTEAFQRITELSQEYLNNGFLNPRPPLDISPLIPAKVELDVLPEVPVLYKDQFETTDQFNQRSQNALVKRQNEVEAAQKEYNEKAQARNNIVDMLDRLHQSDLLLIEQEQQLKLENLAAVFPEIVGWAFREVMGPARLRNLRYDADSQTIHGEIFAEFSDYFVRFSQAMPPALAKDYYNNPSAILPLLTYKVLFDQSGNSIANQRIQLVEVKTLFNGEFYPAQVSVNEFQPQMISFRIADVKLTADEPTQYDLTLQNPVLMDRVMVNATRVINRPGNVDDDLTPLISNLPQAREDGKKWLFLVGIENYAEADPVDYSLSSAEAFRDLAARVLGLKESHIYFLKDSEATTAMIKNKLGLMLERVEPGDVVYFYFSGHGMPSKDPAADQKVEFDTYLVPYDGIPSLMYRYPEFQTKAIYKQLTDSQAGKVFCIIDACFSGESEYGAMTPQGLAAPRLVPKREEYDKKKMALLSATQSGQTARAYKEKGHRLFSYWLMKSLISNSGKNPSVEDLFNEYARQVKNVSYEAGDAFRQDPQISGKIELGFIQ